MPELCLSCGHVTETVQESIPGGVRWVCMECGETVDMDYYDEDDE